VLHINTAGNKHCSTEFWTHKSFLLNTPPKQHSGTPGPFALTLEELLDPHSTSDTALQPYLPGGSHQHGAGSRAYNTTNLAVSMSNTFHQEQGRCQAEVGRASSAFLKAGLEEDKLLFMLSKDGC